MISLVVLLQVMPLVTGLVGYDCSNPGLSRPYLTASAHECSELSHPLTHSAQETGFVVQIPVKSTAPGKMCMVTETSRRFYCSYERNLQHRLDGTMFSHFTPRTVSVADCRLWWSTGKAHGPWGEEKVAIGETVVAIQKGLITEDGWCKEWKTTINVKAWRITRATVTVTSIYSETGSAQNFLSQEEDLIMLAGADQGTTAAGATIFWTGHDLVPCKLELIRKGSFNISTTASGVKWAIARGTGSAIQIGSATEVCGQHLYQTSEPFTFYGNLGDADQPRFTKARVGRVATALNARINYALLSLHSGDHGSQKESLAAMCRLEAEVRRIHLTDAGVSPAQLAYRTFGTPGKALHKAGEGFRLASCESIDVKISPQAECYDLIPVVRRNSSSVEYLDPTVMSLHATAKKIDCSDPSLPIIVFNGAAHELSPELKFLTAPAQLPSSIKHTNSVVEIPIHRLYRPHVLMDTDPRVTMVEAAKQRSDFLANSWETVAQIATTGSEPSPSDQMLTSFRNGVLGHIGWTTVWLILLTISQLILWWRARKPAPQPIYTQLAPITPTSRAQREIAEEINRTRSVRGESGL